MEVLEPMYEIVLDAIIKAFGKDYVEEMGDGIIIADDEDTNTGYKVTIDIIP